MHRPVPVAALAGCFGLSGFAVAIVSGLASGRDAAYVLEDALLALLICWVVGSVVGRIAQTIVSEHLTRVVGEPPGLDPAGGVSLVDAEGVPVNDAVPESAAA
jgi:tetrahydromethanopterin S-methyltransferase subunit C